MKFVHFFNPYDNKLNLYSFAGTIWKNYEVLFREKYTSEQKETTYTKKYSNEPKKNTRSYTREIPRVT